MTLEIITAPSLTPFRHGFFTRKGGASSGVFAGLNCGNGSSDQSEIVAINRARVAEAMEVPVARLVNVQQVHSARVEVVDGPFDGPAPEADGLVTATPGVAIAVLTADCQPVLFADAEAGVIGAAHAGWRGAIDGVLEETIAAMVRLGAERESIQAVIGPTISQRAYEVGPEFKDRFLQEHPDNTRYFRPSERAQHFMFDLPAFITDKLEALGLGDVADLALCTYADEDRFFSYRRTTHRKEPDYGRQISAIALL